MTDPIGTAQELIEPIAKALYEHWVAEDFANEYASWEELGDKATWQSRACAVLQSDALQSRIAEVGRLEEALRYICADVEGMYGQSSKIVVLQKIGERARAALSLQRRV